MTTRGILTAVGGTPAVKLQRIVPGGCARVLRRRHARMQIVAVEPAESPVLSGGAPGASGRGTRSAR